MNVPELESYIDEGDLVRSLREDVRAGLTAEPKWLPPKWFYDARGSALFEEMNPSLINRVTSLLHDAILAGEPRIDLRAVDVTAADTAGVLQIRIDYGIRGTNSRYNMVFPFYLNEAVAPGL